MSSIDRGGYINRSIVNTDTGFSTANSYFYWNIGLVDRRYYVLHLVCSEANIHVTRLTVMNDFGDLVVMS
jgi:hypothetical protein